MAAKKATPRPAAKLAPILKFKKEWIFDPPPQFLNLNREALTRINQLRNEFVDRVNEVIRTGQK